MANLLSDLVDSIVALPGEFGAVVAHDPLSAALLVVGAVLTLGSVAVMAYLTAGALLDYVIPDPSGPAPGQRAR